VLASISSASVLGATGRPVTVEVHVGTGLPSYQIIGLPDEACRESRDRVRAAVLSSGLAWPTDKRVTVNLAPSGERKTGAGLDVAIAVGVLAAFEQLPSDAAQRYGYVGELGLDGSLRPVPGVAPMVGVLCGREVVVPVASQVEARVVATAAVHPVSRLREIADVLIEGAPWPESALPELAYTEQSPADLADVHGQPIARLALEVAAAGGHHLLFVGPPGAGKTMLASRLVGILPNLERQQALEVTMIHSAAGLTLPPGGLVRRPPFRAPHHTSSVVALVGGGAATLRPGEASIAHGGVLFLDELGEFAPSVLDGLRQPLEDGVIRVARANIRATLPARFLLIGATNPCPCGEAAPGACACGATAKAKYVRRFSGPLLDRFDLRVPVHMPGVDALVAGDRGEPTALVARRVAAARRRSLDRAGVLNGALAPDDLDRHAPIDHDARALLRAEIERGRLTGRGYHRIRRVARTIADLRGEPPDVIGAEIVEEALQFRVRLRSPVPGRVA